MTEIQRQFEEFAVMDGLPVDYSHTLGFYMARATEKAWQAWQASRAAIVVELPPQHEVVYDGYDGAELRYALKQIGVNYE